MIKNTDLWTINEIQRRFPTINFPEYQREPNVWSKAAKQRLVDSILRRFDIASIYLYENDDGSFDCIDGRQRLGAIMSFLDENPEDEDAGFSVNITNEIWHEETPRFSQFDGRSYQEIAAEARAGNEAAQEFVNAFRQYEVTVVKLSQSQRPDEFNLQFTRLNLGTIINSGEKLHAMVGDMRDICFGPMKDNAYLQAINIPTRRYAKQQVAAQILAQVFSRWQSGDWTRTRHYDLQRFFKEKSDLTDEERGLVEEIGEIMRLVADALDDPDVLRNRAVSVSTVLLAWEEDVNTEEEAAELAEFIQGFMCRLLWQVGKGLEADPEYHYLVDFNRNVTQASVEKYSVENRANVLREEFRRWRETGSIQGDEEYRDKEDSDPGVDCQNR